MRGLIVLAFLLAGCSTSTLPFRNPAGDGGGGGGDGGGRDLGACTTYFDVQQSLRNKVDVLFVIDNSNGMDAKQLELRNRFPAFVNPFVQLAQGGIYADLHVGVITSDYGAGTGAPGCTPSPGGQLGRLQAIGANAAFTCKKPVGANYVAYQFGPGGGSPSNNLPPGQDLVATFQCMAAVGSFGCGFEHTLESTYAALRNGVPENLGFLRDDAQLVVVFVTDEDDASASPDTDVFDRNKTAQYGYEASYPRQTRFGVMCCPPGRNACAPAELVFPPYGDSGGPLAGCVPAPNSPTGAGPGKLYDVSRYVRLFTNLPAQGGIKSDPRSILLVGIMGPEAPFEVILANPATPAGQRYVECPQLNEASNPPCIPVLQYACMNQAAPMLYGTPAVRLGAVLRSVQRHSVTSICDGDYSAALDGVAKQAVSAPIAGCVPAPLPKDGGGSLVLSCAVESVTQNPDGTQTVVTIPQCPGNGANPGASPCWRIEAKDACTGLSPDGVGLTVDRAGQPAPDHTTAQARCAASC